MKLAQLLAESAAVKLWNICCYQVVWEIRTLGINIFLFHISKKYFVTWHIFIKNWKSFSKQNRLMLMFNKNMFIPNIWICKTTWTNNSHIHSAAEKKKRKFKFNCVCILYMECYNKWSSVFLYKMYYFLKNIIFLLCHWHKFGFFDVLKYIYCIKNGFIPISILSLVISPTLYTI